MKFRQQFSELQSKKLELDKELQILDQGECPLTEDELEAVRVSLVPHLQEGEYLESVLLDEEKRNKCISWVELVEKAPTNPQFGFSEEEDEQAEAIAKNLLSSFEELEMGFLRPEAWKKVTNELKSKLAKVLEEHLPRTVSGLWEELVMNLTPAPWQILGGLRMKVDSRRGKPETRLLLDVKDSDPRLARYVLNKAETLALGLAWFLVKYICQGRFQCSVLSLDDPAYDMDQTTFRDFCRLMESLLRFHRISEDKLPLSMLIFLHQDERALDAARATGGLLHRLVWNSGEASISQKVKLYSGEHLHPLPDCIFDS